MITFAHTVNERRILYLPLAHDLGFFETLQLLDWAVLVVADATSGEALPAFAGLCIDKDVLYMAATGKAGSAIDDLFDETMVVREVFGGKRPAWMKTEDDCLMTTWHDQFEEAFWFITSGATYEDWPIHTVLVANFTTTDYSARIAQLIHQINQGWLPRG